MNHAGTLPLITVGPFALLLLAFPVVLLGEALNRRFTGLRRLHIPAAILGGLLVAAALLVLGELRPGLVRVSAETASLAWLWSVLPQWDFSAPRAAGVERPLLILFFTCMGLNASLALARKGGRPLLVFFALASVLSVLQAVVGAALARALGENPLLGVLAGTTSLMGGFGTVAGFAPEFTKAGLAGAPVIGVAAAAYGVIAGGVLAGVLGGRLIEGLGAERSAGSRGAQPVDAGAPRPGLIALVRQLAAMGRPVVLHLAVLLLCMKAGAFLSGLLQAQGLTFPVYMGALVVAALTRTVHDGLGGRWLRTDCTDVLGAVALTWLLAVVMVNLQLAQLSRAALPLLVLLAVQTVVMVAAARWLVFRLMGRDHEAAVMTAGLVGFGLGATSNALASMREITARFGPAPRAFLIVPIVGAFLIDFTNASVTTLALNLLR
ncbi:MAG: sodium/glutamate symporter [Opitutaceae bacterium]